MTTYKLTREALEESWENFNPTVEDYLKFTFLINNPTKIWTDKSGETVFYLNINLTLTLGFASMHGGENIAMLRVMQKANLIKNLAMNPFILVPLATYVGAKSYMAVMTHYEPHEHHQKPSYWRSIAQAIGAGGVGVGTGADSFV